MAWKFALAASIPCLMAVAGLASAADDKSFITEAIWGDNSEIALGRLAAMKGGEGVKEFGQELMNDHRQAREDATSLANKIGVKPPEGITDETVSEDTQLKGLSGAAFDREFTSYMVKDYKEDLQKFKQQANSGSGATADLARDTIPVLKKHLATAEKLAHIQ